MVNGCLSDYTYNKKNKLTLKQKYSILIDICSGMCFLHSKTTPIIHRDLKTQNILLNDKLEAKISDFGISKLFNENLVSTSIQKGTPSYQSPGYLKY
jgi:serine/threonine protein kinase